MSSPLLIIITGLPCSGKTTLGKRLAADLRLPYFYKDGIKELLFERLGWQDRAWSRLLSLASYDVLFQVMEAQLQAGRSSIVESNFNAAVDTPKFLALFEGHPFTPFQLVCRAPGEVLLQRYQRRAELAERHPGHLDRLILDELREPLLTGLYIPLELPGQWVEVDTTDFHTIDYASLLERLRSLVQDTA
jgi:predicted kinase